MIYDMQTIKRDKIQRYSNCKIYEISKITTHFNKFLFWFVNYEQPYCGFESRRGHGCLSVVSVMCCQVEISATGRSLVQRSPTDCDVIVRYLENLRNEEAKTQSGL